MPVPHRLLACTRFAAAATLPVLLLSACAFWTSADAPQRTSFSISAPSTIQRPEWLQREVTRMDAEAFPLAGLPLKLSYELSPASAAAVASVSSRRTSTTAEAWKRT